MCYVFVIAMWAIGLGNGYMLGRWMRASRDG